MLLNHYCPCFVKLWIGDTVGNMPILFSDIDEVFEVVPLYRFLVMSICFSILKPSLENSISIKSLFQILRVFLLPCAPAKVLII